MKAWTPRRCQTSLSSGSEPDRSGRCRLWGDVAFGEGHGLVEVLSVLEAVVELADHAVEEVALGGGGVPVALFAAAPVVALAPVDARSEAKTQR